MTTTTASSRTTLLGGGIFGIGLGGLVDVLVFHLIFQSHHLLSNRVTPRTYSGLQENIYYDGLFAFGMLGVMVVGSALVWRAVNGQPQPRSTLALVGSILVGMGLFNTVDGIVSHYLLDIHDVVHGTTFWNPPWVLVSVILFLLGAALLYRGRRQHSD